MEETTFHFQNSNQEPKVLIVPTKSKRKILKIILGLIVIGIFGFFITLYTRAFDPLWNPFRPEPEEVMNEMTKKMAEVKTLHSETKFDFLTREEDTKETFKMTTEFWSDSDATEKENPKSTGNFSITLAIEGMQFLLAGENKTIGKDSYLKLTTLPASPFFEAYLSQIGIDINQIKNQWIKIDEESIKNLLKSLGMETETKEETKQKEMVAKFQEILKNRKFYLVKKEFPDEEIGNQKVYHYLVTLNKEEVKKIIPEFLKAMIDMGFFPQPPTETEWQEFEKEFPKEFDKFFQKIGDIEGEIWIGKKDLYLYKIKGEKEIDLSKFEESEKGKITINFEMNFSDFNKPLKIEAPKEYKGLEEILKPQIEKLPSMKPVDFVEYYNKDYSYRINYPKDWKMLEGKPANPKILHYVAFLSPDYLSSFSIDVESVSSLKEELEVIKEKSKVKEIIINRCKGYEIINLAEPGMKFWMFLCKEKGYFLSCVFLNDPSICDQIVNTFIIE
jgi:hypothetical protein